MPGFGSDNFALNPHFFGSAGQTIASLQNFTNPGLADADPEKLGSAVTQLTNAYVAADISDARGLFESLRRGTIRPEEAREELIKITEGLQDSKTWERIKGALKRQSVRFRPVGQIVKDLKLNKDRMEFIGQGNRDEVATHFESLVRDGLEIKTRPDFLPPFRPQVAEWTTTKPPQQGMSIETLKDALLDVAEWSAGFGSPNFIGFQGAGNSVAANLAGMLAMFLNQNLINESHDAPAATFVELETISWLRQLVGYPVPEFINAARDAGGVAVIGGVQSNAIGLLAAREKLFPGSLLNGLNSTDVSNTKIITPGDINHYSVRSSLGWLGLGQRSLLQAPIGEDRKYDLSSLRDVIQRELSEGHKIMALVAYAGDSRTQAIDRLDALGQISKEFGIWFHVDACNGLQLLCSKNLRERMKGIEQADSIAVDPHKGLWIPYNLSYALFRDPESLANIGSSSDLITKERWAFGAFTPFTGSKAFNSFKLWALIKHLGIERIGELVEQNLDLIEKVEGLVDQNGALLRLNETDINSIVFIYLPPRLRKHPDPQLSQAEIDKLNELNSKIYQKILEQGSFYVHSFPLKDHGHQLNKSTQYPLQVLRFMFGNPLTTLQNFEEAVNTIVQFGDEIAKDLY